MKTIEQQELAASAYVVQEAASWAIEYSQPGDLEAATLALLWAALEQEAMAQGLTKWRGIELGDIE